MAHDDIPEDKEQSFPCDRSDPTGEKFCLGSIRMIDGKWQCDTCYWGEDDLKPTESDNLEPK